MKSNGNSKQVMDVYFRTTGSYEIREEELNGDAYIVVPVTMMVQGVHSGSHGAVFHPAEELGKFPASWDGIPITIAHPQVGENYVSANSPSILTEWSCGMVFNTKLDGEKLKSEAWINVEDITTMRPDLLQRIKDLEEIEVSVGVFSDEEDVTGTFNGENYIGIAHNHRPDHLALLPDEIGACSLTDGCGIRVNKKGGTKMFVLNSENRNEVLKELNKQGFSVFETGHGDLAQKAREAVYAKDRAGFSYYIDEIFNDYLVFRENNYNGETSVTKLYKQSYQENAAGEVELTGEAVQVKREVTYVQVPQINGSVKRTRTKFNNNQKGGNEMPQDCQICKDKATELIANKNTPYTEDDRSWMESLEVNQLEKLAPKTVEKEVPAVVTNAQVIAAFKESMKTPEDFMGIMPEGMRDQFKNGMEMQTNAKGNMVKAIMANAEGVWEEAELEAMPSASVTKIYKSLSIEEDDTTIYVGGGRTPEVNTDSSVEVMAPLGVVFKS